MKYNEPASLKDALSLGLTKAEWKKILKFLKRIPNFTELGIFSALWSEHCSYKSSKIYLKKFPTKSRRVLQGPGENAGIIKLDEELCVVFKMESHNHPSYIEPFQGAATGVGGILRDIFTMGARPIANMDSLFFGDLKEQNMAYLLNGVVGGIAFYGNCIGVPTVGGQTLFYNSYNNNILVNVFCLGIAKQNEIFYGKAKGKGNPLFYVGSKTGRDGIHGATMASEAFEEDLKEKKPNVQIGDPFTEKLLLEALLEIMKGDSIEGIQDMGAAGLTSSSFEMADRGGSGLVLYLDRVPLREKGMDPYEIMLSESQERMLMVVKKGKEKEVLEVFKKWDLDAVEIGYVTDTGKVEGYFKGEKVIDLDIKPLVSGAPKYRRPVKKPSYFEELNREEDLKIEIKNFEEELVDFLKNPNNSSKKSIYRQYDHQVQTNTVLLPSFDSALLRVKGKKYGIAITSDVNPLWCYLNPKEGSSFAVAEAVRNLASIGAKPIGVTDCLNFGNPENPEVMWQFKESIEGLTHALKYFKIPVVSGNVSFYNETKGKSIWPTPTIGMVGFVSNIKKIPDFKPEEGSSIFLAGDGEIRLSSSSFSVHKGYLLGRIPELDLERERKLQNFLIKGFGKGFFSGAHDISEGGLIISLIEIFMLSKKGMEMEISSGENTLFLFGEGGGRAVVFGDDRGILNLSKEFDIPIQKLGSFKGRDFYLRAGGWKFKASFEEIEDIMEEGLSKYME
ncbi:MAG: phosphoribosylformylglycinamidine synthase subunit PurL [Thermoanaerobaculia bacterium]